MSQERAQIDKEGPSQTLGKDHRLRGLRDHFLGYVPGLVGDTLYKIKTLKRRQTPRSASALWCSPSFLALLDAFQAPWRDRLNRLVYGPSHQSVSRRNRSEKAVSIIDRDVFFRADVKRDRPCFEAHISSLIRETPSRFSHLLYLRKKRTEITSSKNRAR